MKSIAVWLAMLLSPATGQNSAIPNMNQVMTFSYPMETGAIMYLSRTTLPPETKGAVRAVICFCRDEDAKSSPGRRRVENATVPIPR